MKQKLLNAPRRALRRLGALVLALTALGDGGALRAQVIEGHRLISWADASGRIRIPDGVTELAPSALKGNSSVTHIDFNGVRLIGADACAEMSALTGFDAPLVEELGAHVFEGNKAVTGVQLPASLKRIGRAAFADTNIEELSLPSALQSIGAYAFAGSKLRRATIPESVKRVGVGIFLLCSQLEELEYLAKAPILRVGTLGIYGHTSDGKPALRRLVFGRHIQGFPRREDGRDFIEQNYSWYQLFMSPGVKIEELVSHSPEPMQLERYVNRVKRLYVPAGLLEVYRAQDRKYPEIQALCACWRARGAEWRAFASRHRAVRLCGARGGQDRDQPQGQSLR